MLSNNQFSHRNGWLELILGCMFSGKTSALEKIFKQHSLCGIECIAINYHADKRYSDTMLSTHDKTTIPCLFAEKLAEITDDVAKYPVILINEGQFFQDLVPWVEDRLKEKKISTYVVSTAIFSKIMN